jgi:hypothetical protein
MLHEKAGVENTGRTLEVAPQYAKTEGIRDIVVASTTGYFKIKVKEILIKPKGVLICYPSEPSH